MRKLSRKPARRSLRPSWREYQSGLQRKRNRSRFMQACMRLGAIAALITAGSYGLLTGLAGSGCQASRSPGALATAPAPAPESPAPAPAEAAPRPKSPDKTSAASPETGESPPAAPSTEAATAAANTTAPADNAQAKEPAAKQPPDGPDGHLTKADLQSYMGSVDFTNHKRPMLFFKVNDKPYNAETHLDITLQERLLERMDRKNSRHIGIVALDPVTGRVITMASFDKTAAPLNPCVSDQYPAASIFKIVSAIAAAEALGYRPDTVLKYNGYAHTLYKKQLKETSNKYTNRIAFKNAFAKSINPVFGKIGALYLRGDALSEFADIMGFNRQVPFELPLPPSKFTPSDKPYRWAELASGFNRETTISPLHAAIIAAAVVNEGQLIEPTVLKAVRNENQALVYRSEPRVWAQAMSPETVKTLKRLMEATVRNGTARKTFRNQRRDKVLSRLIIGGKTGSIFNRAHDARFDWFAGYAREKEGTDSLAIGVVVAHEEFIGRRAGEYARIAFRHYFQALFARQADEKAGKPKGAS